MPDDLKLQYLYMFLPMGMEIHKNKVTDTQPLPNPPKSAALKIKIACVSAFNCPLCHPTDKATLSFKLRIVSVHSKSWIFTLYSYIFVSTPEKRISACILWVYQSFLWCKWIRPNQTAPFVSLKTKTIS